MSVRVRDLKDSYPQGHVLLRCPDCRSESSAHLGDYWNYRRDHIFTCPHCRVELLLVSKRVVFEEVQL